MAYVDKQTQSGKVVKLKDYKKKVRRNRRRRRIFFALLILIALICFLMVAPFFNIKTGENGTVQVVGNQSVPAEEILTAAGVSQGDNIFRFNTSRAKAQIEAIPYILEVQLTRKFPNVLLITVTERTVFASVYYREHYYYLDRYGQVLEAHDAAPSEGAPLVIGANIAAAETGQVLQLQEERQLSDLLALFGELDKLHMQEKITYIDVTDADKLTITVKDQLEVLVGDSSNLEYKLGFLMLEAYEYLGDSASGTMDVSGGKRAVYKEKK